MDKIIDNIFNLANVDFLICISGILIGISLFIESASFIIRIIGKNSEKSSLGYSLHVQIATLSRLGSFVGLPIIGLLLDKKVETYFIVLIPFISYIVMSFGFLFILIKLDFVINIYNKIFMLRVKNANEFKLTNFSFRKLKLDLNQIWILSFLSFSITTISFFLIPIIASLYNEYRATILQLAPVFTSFGTFISIFMFDNNLSKLIDSNIDIHLKINTYISIIFSRLISSFIIIILILRIWII